MAKSENTRASVLDNAIETRSASFIGDKLYRFSLLMALVGGFILTGVALLIVFSIIGRLLVPYGLSSVPGDIELTEIGIAVAVFCFLPWCQMNAGHATVDIFVDNLPKYLQNFFVLLGNCALAAAALMIALRHFQGMLDKLNNGETSFILGLPIWWGFAFGLAGAVLFSIVSLYTLWRDFDAFYRGA